MTLTSTVALIATMVLLSATPGPVDFVLVAYAAQKGWRPASLAVLGIVLADFVFIGLALAGLGYAAQNFESIFLGLQLFAVVLLLWFGWRYLKAKPTSRNQVARISGLGGFISGFMLTIGDPRVILFYMSLLPAYLDLAAASLTDAVTIMLCATLAIGAVKAVFITLARQAQHWLSSSKAQLVMHRIAGGLLWGVGLYLLLQVTAEFA
jgi:threonine/homoserine/homoserine lactone efflux protein